MYGRTDNAAFISASVEAPRAQHLEELEQAHRHGRGSPAKAPRTRLIGRLATCFARKAFGHVARLPPPAASSMMAAGVPAIRTCGRRRLAKWRGPARTVRTWRGCPFQVAPARRLADDAGRVSPSGPGARPRRPRASSRTGMPLPASQDTDTAPALCRGRPEPRKRLTAPHRRSQRHVHRRHGRIPCLRPAGLAESARPAAGAPPVCWSRGTCSPRGSGRLPSPMSAIPPRAGTRTRSTTMTMQDTRGGSQLGQMHLDGAAHAPRHCYTAGIRRGPFQRET